jgi:exopolysaccharide biosynthesis protein
MSNFPIEKLQHHVQSVLPQVYDDSLSFVELVNKVVIKLNEVIDTSNDYFNEDLSDYTRQILQEWYDNGKLADILNDDVLTLKASTEYVDQLHQDNAYFHGITVEQRRDDLSETDYILTTIPYKDPTTDEVIQIKRGFGGDNTNGRTPETARNFANRHSATVTLNASIFDINNFRLQGVQIQDGVVLNTEVIPSRYILGIKEDNEFKVYPPETDPITILNDGCRTALTSFIPLIENGNPVSSIILDDYTGGQDGQLHPRQILCQYPNKDIVIVSVEGRLHNDKGMDNDDLIRILTDLRVDFAFMLDGGGSVQTVVRGTLVNTPSDDKGHTERVVPDFLYFGKDHVPSPRDRDISLTNEQLGVIAKKVSDLFVDLDQKTDMNEGFIRLKGAEGYVSQGIESWSGDTKNTKLLMNDKEIYFWDYINEKYIMRFLNGDIYTETGRIGAFWDSTVSVSDLNQIERSGIYWATGATLNVPSAVSWGVLVIRLNNDAQLQIAVSFVLNTNDIRVRRKSSGVWGAWS